MSQFIGPGGGIGKGSWKHAAAAGYNPSQIKTAIQQLHQNTGIAVGSGVRTDHMQGVQGIAHGINQYQGPGGNLGLNSYNQVKAAGYDIQDIPTLAAQGGMFLPKGAMAQWKQDIADSYATQAPPTPTFNLPEFTPPEMPRIGSNTGGGGVTGTALGIAQAGLGALGQSAAEAVASES